MAKFVLISDTHMRHNDLTIPDCDFLIHSGDATGRGEEFELVKFLKWMSEQPARHKIFIPGNHDFDIEYRLEYWGRYCADLDIYLLHNEGLELDGFSFYGTADQPIFFDWAFNKSSTQREASFSNIPEGLDFLITHSPPYGILDMVQYPDGTDKMPAGCMHLWKHVRRTTPKFHIFGHIHEGYGYKDFCGTKFYNASICNSSYYPENDPWVFDYTK